MRVGLHWEPVILDENDVFGSGVNIAVRLQDTAPTGGIVVSRALLKELNGRDDLKFEDLGHLHLKNLSRPIHAYAMALPGVNRVARVNSRLSAKLPSVAVLPFSNLSSDASHTYFADGIAEDIVVTLSNLSELLVVSRSSTMALRSRRSNPLKIGERLGVRYLLTGNGTAWERRSENLGGASRCRHRLDPLGRKLSGRHGKGVRRPGRDCRQDCLQDRHLHPAIGDKKGAAQAAQQPQCSAIIC